jgi:hypothetical protein
MVKREHVEVVQVILLGKECCATTWTQHPTNVFSLESDSDRVAWPLGRETFCFLVCFILIYKPRFQATVNRETVHPAFTPIRLTRKTIRRRGQQDMR